MADQLRNSVRDPLVCMKCRDHFDYNYRSYYFNKQVGDVVTAYDCFNDEEIHMSSNLCSSIR